MSDEKLIEKTAEAAIAENAAVNYAAKLVIANKRIAELEDAMVFVLPLIDHKPVGWQSEAAAKLRTTLGIGSADADSAGCDHDVRACSNAHPEEFCGSMHCHDCKYFPYTGTLEQAKSAADTSSTVHTEE